MRWCGSWNVLRRYEAGELVEFRRRVLISKTDGNFAIPLLVLDGVWRTDPDWVLLGEMGPSPTRVVHAWHPQPLQYPCGDNGEMSEPVSVCDDCFKDADYRNMFNARVHLYLIPEWGHGLV